MFPQRKNSVRSLVDSELSYHHTPLPVDGMGDLKEIVTLFTSGTVRSYLTKLKTLIGQVTQQYSMSKMMTFCFGLVELLN